ncbi:MAG TPA: LacI family DNA-binding transcriptional regulator [Terriglobia bacterium]|nr:LacI family DNA-binding transcriptional regulator [Terriglobia bacterium]
MRKIGVEEIARLANVSIGTVDRALHNRKEISEGTRKRILRIAKEHGYRPNLAARALSVGNPVIRIGVCIPREIHYFYDQVRDGFLNEARRFEQLGVEIVYRPIDRLGGGEAAAMKELLSRKLQVVAVCPGDPASLTSLINQAEQHENVRVICVASDAPGSARSTVVCVNPVVNGHMAAELMAKFLPPKPDVAVLTGQFLTEDHRKKVQAFAEMFQQLSPGGRLVEVLEGHDDEDETFQKVYALLGRHQSLKGIYVSTANCLPVCHAVGARGLHGKVKLITTDLFQAMVPYLEKGTILASIHQRPYVQGQVAVRLVVDHLANGRPIPPSYYLTPHLVLRSNLRLFREIRRDEMP